MISNTNVNPSFEFECDILEFTKRPYVNKKGENVEFVSCLIRMDGKVFKLSVSKGVDLTSLVGGKSNLRFELSTWGDDLNPKLSIVGEA